jgi:hypothetical protein
MTLRLEHLSDRVRRGELVTLGELLEVIDYQETLQAQLRRRWRDNPLLVRLRRRFRALWDR